VCGGEAALLYYCWQSPFCRVTEFIGGKGRGLKWISEKSKLNESTRPLRYQTDSVFLAAAAPHP
jgi:hypothetical protein